MHGFFCVHGTHDDPASPKSWCHTNVLGVRELDAPLIQEAEAAGLTLLDRDRRWYWDGELGGAPLSRRQIWPAAAESLYSRVEDDVPLVDLNFWCHSWGGAVGILLAEQVPINVLITVGTPPKKDIREAGAQALAKGHIRAWRHIYDRIDWIRTAANLVDWELRWSGAFELEHLRFNELRINGIRHSRVLSDPKYAAVRQGWVDLVKQSSAEWVAEDPAVAYMTVRQWRQLRSSQEAGV